jgi:ABC-type nitrate/sulfonate/bicarbonate transport system substrate-binding protein
MSTSRDTRTRTDDRLVTVITRWLARHVSDEELRSELVRVAPGELAEDQAEAVQELLAALGDGGDRARVDDRARVEMVARETLEALALGG